MGLPLIQLMVWVSLAALGAMVLPVVLGWLPAITEFIVNFVLWLIWVLKYRNNK